MPYTTGVSGDAAGCYTTPGQSGKRQLVGVGQPKDGYALVTRSNLAVADTAGAPYDPTAATTIDCDDATSLWISGDSNLASAQLTLVVAMWQMNPDGTETFMGLTETLGLAVGDQFGGSFQVGGRYCVLGPQQIVDLAAASKIAVIVTSITPSSNWNLYYKLF